MKLFTIGDSISQGFMSGAAARTELSYSTILARILSGLPPTSPVSPDYRFPEWPVGGLPLNLERIMRALNQRYGSDISGLEWVSLLGAINRVIDESEDYYERGDGSEDRPYPGNVPFFHNVSVRGFTVADSWQVTPALSRRIVRETGETGDGFLTGPSQPFHRTALRVLNPSLQSEFMNFSQLDWLDRHVAQDGGVENLILWLGANNALGTILTLSVNQTPGPNRIPEPSAFSAIPYLERERGQWNLWHPDDFQSDYVELLRRVDGAMSKNKEKDWRVFVGNVPQVTIAPLAKGVGDKVYVTSEIDGEKVTQVYFKLYTYFPFEEAFAHDTELYLTVQEAIHVDRCILRFNEIITNEVERIDAGRGRYHVVNLARVLRTMAFKRNDSLPTYKFPEYLELQFPRVNTKYYFADTSGQLRHGGIFGLDGVHPTAITHGILAWEFLKTMQAAGRAVDPDALGTASVAAQTFWRTVVASDDLYSRPISLMHEVYDHDKLARHLIKLIRMLSPGRKKNPQTL